LTIYLKIRQNRSAWFQPVTLSVALDSLCSDALHRTMLVWLLYHQSYILRFITFLRNKESKWKCIKIMKWFQSG